MPPTLRVLTFLAPNMFPVYQFITAHLAARLGRPMQLHAGHDYEQLLEADLAFVCGLAYIEFESRGDCPLEPIAAPVLIGKRFVGRPIYFSDIVVHRDSPFRRFADLRGRSWCYNEPLSQSGHGVTLYHLARMGETCSFFGRVIQAGWHEQSIRLVASGEVDGSAIDCQVLAVALRDNPELARRLRVIDALGPSTIQPLVASTRLSAEFRKRLRKAMVELAQDRDCQRHLARGFIDRFVSVRASDYEDLRQMRRYCTQAGLIVLDGERNGVPA